MPFDLGKHNFISGKPFREGNILHKVVPIRSWTGSNLFREIDRCLKAGFRTGVAIKRRLWFTMWNLWAAFTPLYVAGFQVIKGSGLPISLPPSCISIYMMWLMEDAVEFQDILPCFRRKHLLWGPQQCQFPISLPSYLLPFQSMLRLKKSH